MPIPTPPTLSQYTLTNFLNLLSSGGFEATFEWAIGKWADVCDQLLSTVIPASITAQNARGAFIATMQPMATSIADGIPLLEQAFLTYATILSTGMVGAGFTGVPPTSSPSIQSIVNGPQPAEAFASLLESILIPWAKTGQAIPLSGGATINWN